MDIISNLPVEMTVEIFKYLSYDDLVRCSCVSQAWKMICNVNSLWKSVCWNKGWRDTDMVDNFYSHLPPPREENYETPYWKLNFIRNYLLPKKWERGDCLTYNIKLTDSPVSCMDCDGETLVAGHMSGEILVYSVKTLPYHITTFKGQLEGYRVLKVKTFSKYIVLLQSKLLQFYIFDQNKEQYTFVDAKSFEMGYGLIEVCIRTKARGKRFQKWYAKSIGGDKYVKDMVNPIGIYFHIKDNIVYVGVRSYQMIYAWSLDDGLRKDTIHIRNHTSKLRDLVLKDDVLYVIYASRNIRHISAYDLHSKTWLYEVTTLDCKTQKIIVADTFLCGVGVGAAGFLHKGKITIWEKESGVVISERSTTEVVSFKNATTAMGVIIYSEGTLITVWEPRSNMVMKQFSLRENAVFIRALPFTLLLVCSNNSCQIWNWLSGQCLYRTSASIAWNGDYSNQLWHDSKMVLIKSGNDQINMLAYI